MFPQHKKETTDNCDNGADDILASEVNDTNSISRLVCPVVHTEDTYSMLLSLASNQLQGSTVSQFERDPCNCILVRLRMQVTVAMPSPDTDTVMLQGFSSRLCRLIASLRF